jgi:hypothetical protein
MFFNQGFRSWLKASVGVSKSASVKETFEIEINKGANIGLVPNFAK